MNLTAALAVVAAAELVLHRIIGRLFLSQHPEAGLGRAAAVAGRFVFHLGGVLGIVLFAAAVAAALRRRTLFARPMRLAVAAITVFVLVLSVLGIFFLVQPPRFVVHLKTSQAFLAWFVALSVWRSAGPVRVKFGVTLFALPPILQAFSVFAERAVRSATIPTDLLRSAAICALVAGALAPYLLAPEPARMGRRLFGVVVGLLSLTGILVGLMTQFDLVQAVALYGFRLDIPPLTSGTAVAYVGLVMAAFVGLAMAIVWTLTESGASRLCGYGLVLVAASGYQALSADQVLFAICGLLAMAAGISGYSATTTTTTTATAVAPETTAPQTATAPTVATAAPGP